MSVTRQNVPQRPSTKSPLHSPAGKAKSWNLKPLAAGCPSSRGSGACTSSGTPGWCRLYLAALHTRFRLLAQARRGRQGLCQAASSKDKPTSVLASFTTRSLREEAWTSEPAQRGAAVKARGEKSAHDIRTARGRAMILMGQRPRGRRDFSCRLCAMRP